MPPPNIGSKRRRLVMGGWTDRDLVSHCPPPPGQHQVALWSLHLSRTRKSSDNWSQSPAYEVEWSTCQVDFSSDRLWKKRCNEARSWKLLLPRICLLWWTILSWVYTIYTTCFNSFHIPAILDIRDHICSVPSFRDYFPSVVLFQHRVECQAYISLR